MKRINLTEKAELNRTPISQIDTYGQIPKEKIQEMDDRGYDIIQVATEKNQHIRFEWQKREV